MFCIIVQHEGRLICYGPFKDSEAVVRYKRKHELHMQPTLVVPMHDSEEALES
jgi:uncharacterized protein YciI